MRCEERVATIMSGTGLLYLLLCLLGAPVLASHHYTEKQLDALATRVGKGFWVVPVDGKLPLFHIAPSSNAGTFQPAANQAFEIVELVGRKIKNPYYKVRLDTGKEGYIRVEDFHEQFNSAILTIDPIADERTKLPEQSEGEQQRLEWIRAQPWSNAFKEAAIKRQVAPGMKSGDVKMVLGNPLRTRKVPKRQQIAEEHWFYPAGKILVFQNGILIRVESQQK